MLFWLVLRQAALGDRNRQQGHCLRRGGGWTRIRVAMRKSSCRTRFFTVIFSLWALLFAQVALAAHDCAAVEPIAVAETHQMAEAGLPCAQMMAGVQGDDATPAMCHAHCQSEHQTPDHFQPGSLASIEDFGAALTVVPGIPEAPLGRFQRVGTRDSGPPIAIRHCCFRI